MKNKNIKVKEEATNLKNYVIENKKEISNKCWDILLKILNDRNDGKKYEIVANPQ